MFTVDDLEPLLMQILQSVVESKDYLTQLDAQAGDGDLGVNMERGFSAIAAEVTQNHQKTLQAAFSACARSFNHAAPSTLGTVLSAGLLSFAQDCSGVVCLDRVNFSNMIENAVKTMQELGGAALGDKTILDSMVPYAASLKAQQEEKIWHSAAQAAQQAAEETALLTPRIGRARIYGEKTKGICDGGAVLFAIVAKAIADYVES